VAPARAPGRPGAAALHESYLRHASFRWLRVGTVLSLVCLAGYALVDQRPRPNGGSALGYTLGTIATLLIVWLTMLGLRKRIVGRARYSLKSWTSAHVYLGLAVVIVASLHTGFQFGWNVHTLAYALMLLVVVSGVWGTVVYARLPRRLSANRGELTQPQMLDMLRTLDRHLHEAAQPLSAAHSATVRQSLEQTRIGGGLVARLTGRYPRCGNDRALAAVSATLRGGVADPGGHLAAVAGLLERKAAALAQARRHIRLRALLEVWLYVHVPATFALLAALTAHIVSVFYYW
jgi:hypothetical protein